MNANFSIASKEAIFPAGTIGGDWAWTLSVTEALGRASTAAEPITWTTVDPFTSAEVQPETTYKISGVRIDPDKNTLGEVVSASFTTEALPVDVIIDVADTISVVLT